MGEGRGRDLTLDKNSVSTDYTLYIAGFNPIELSKGKICASKQECKELSGGPDPPGRGVKRPLGPPAGSKPPCGF